MAMAATAGVVFAVTLPFLLPYAELRRLGFPPRALAEVETYSADVYSYWTAAPELRLWGRFIRAYPKPEGDLFPSITALALGGAGALAGLRAGWKRTAGRPAATKPGLTPLVYVLVAGCAVYTIFALIVLFERGFSQIGPLPVAVRSLGRTVGVLAMALGLLLAVSPRARAFLREWLGTVLGFAVLAALLAIVMSFGPEVHSLGREVRGTGPYSLFYWHVPGYDGLRVPARFAMLAMLFLSISAGFGALQIERRFRRGGVIVLLVGVLAMAEAFAMPIGVNGTAPPPVGNYANPPARLFTGDQIPPVYKFLKTQPSPGTVIVEFPLGEWAYELSYVYYSTTHWHPLINGYSGTFPLSYTLRAGLLRRPEENPEAAWQALAASGATHAVVHENFYRDNGGTEVSGWLSAHGARLVGTFDGDKIFELEN